MQVTYINHSCFLVESDTGLFLFDYFDGDIPELNCDKPLYCFSSHSHGDHFSEKLFEKTVHHPNVHYILSDDILKKCVPAELYSRTDFVAPSQTVIIDKISVKTLKSTDLGVAFIVDDDGKLIYHAGDLNDWIWKGESSEYNTNMEASYIKEMEKLRGTDFLLAFIPIDPRQSQNDRQRGIRLFMKYANAENIFPMHMWDKYETAEELAFQLEPKDAALLRNASYRGESFIISEE